MTLMLKSLSRRFLALALALAVLGLSTSAVSHLHTRSAESRCQVCHIGHAAIPGPLPPVAVEVPAPIVRYVAADTSTAAVSPARTASIPRAPPA